MYRANREGADPRETATEFLGEIGVNLKRLIDPAELTAEALPQSETDETNDDTAEEHHKHKYLAWCKECQAQIEGWTTKICEAIRTVDDVETEIPFLRLLTLIYESDHCDSTLIADMARQTAFKESGEMLNREIELELASK